MLPVRGLDHRGVPQLQLGRDVVPQGLDVQWVIRVRDCFNPCACGGSPSPPGFEGEGD